MRIGDYEITEVLPATVDGVLELAATHVLLPRRVHLRVIDQPGLHARAKRLMREACLLEALRNAGIPRIYECGMLEDRRAWIATEWFDGPTLAEAIAERPVHPGQALVMLRDLAEILHYAHTRGVVHCRVRPAHVARSAKGFVITSWGAASTHDSQPDLEEVDRQIYLAPELARGAPCDDRADIYSLGVIVYQALTLAAPSLPLLQRAPTIPAAIAQLVGRMLAASPQSRPSASEVRAEATRLLEKPEQTDGTVEEIELDIEVTPTVTRTPRGRWTPVDLYQHPPPLPPAIPFAARRKH